MLLRTLRSLRWTTRAPATRTSVAALFLALCASSPRADPLPVPLQGTPHRKVVGVLETRAPALSDFLLRGTLPIPRGTYPPNGGGSPFTLLDYDGKPVFTQVEIVSRYPDDHDGADVVELLANVHRDPALGADAPARYAVTYSTGVNTNPPDEQGPVPSVVDELLLDPNGILVQAYDCFGNLYTSHVLQPQPFEVLHHGPVQAELRLYQTMLPEPAIPGSTLPHLFGVHAYLSWFSGRTSVELDLRFHNAHDGHDPSTALDDPLDKVYFQRIEVSLPESWTLQQDFQDPLFGSERVVGGRRVIELVGPNPDGKLHVIRWGGQFHRRLMLSPARPTSMARARAVLDGAGRAFCVRGFTPDSREYWSWWNSETTRYFPQRHQLPRLDHIDRASLEAEIANEESFLASHLASGLGVGDYPIAAPSLGWGHPYGVSYGGMTSGLEIDCYDGIVAAAVASPLGFRLYSALHRMQTDRQPNALYRLDGEPSSVEEWLVENGDRDYVPFEHFVVPLISGSRSDPFGVRSAPRFQVDYVRANNLQPGYEGQYLSFDPHDHQHFIRYTRAPKVLAWLANDSLSKDDLLHQAENFNFSYHPYYNGPYGNVQATGLLQKIQYVESYPGKGFPYGRGEAWGLDCVLAAYSCAAPEWRARKLPWIQKQTEVIAAGQARCSGFIQALVSSKAVDGKYQARQQIEQSITENTLVGLYETVYRDADPGYARMVLDVLSGSLEAFIGEMAWFPGQGAPWRYTGVGPLDPAKPVWCSRAEMPTDAWTAGDVEGFQDWSSFAYGHILTGDPEFLRHARIQLGAVDFDDLFQRLESDGTQNLENRAALLALVQRIEGQL